MRTLVLGDIHANRQALEAVLEDSPPVDEVICLGDLVGYGADPVACVDEARRRGWLTLTGNHDRACTDAGVLSWFHEEAAAALRWTVAELGTDRVTWLAQRPERCERRGAVLVHASPRDPVYEYILDGQTAVANLRLLEGRICFHGHTHVPGLIGLAPAGAAFTYELGKHELEESILVNPGSVGQPRDGDPRASYGIWDSDEGTFTFCRVPYDVAAAQAAIRAAGLPDYFAARLQLGR